MNLSWRLLYCWEYQQICPMTRMLFLLGCFTLVGCSTENPTNTTTPSITTCADMHTGTFEFTSNRGSRFTRADTFQTQYHNDSTVSHFELKWQDDCNYIITLRETNEATYAEYLDRPLAVEITKVSYDTMWFTGTMDSGISFHDTLVRLGD